MPMSRDCQKVEDVFAQQNCNSQKKRKQKRPYLAFGPFLVSFQAHFVLKVSVQDK